MRTIDSEYDAARRWPQASHPPTTAGYQDHGLGRPVSRLQPLSGCSPRSEDASRFGLPYRPIAKLVDADGPGGEPARATYFSWDHDQVVLQFGGEEAAELAHRYLYGPLVDQILADEAVASLSSAGDVLWPLADHLGTVRDLAVYDAGTNATSIANHIAYDSFGNVVSESNAAIDHLFAFTGRERDSETGLQYHRARYYDPTPGRWLSEDPIAFLGEDTNLQRYVDNSPLTGTDSSGLWRLGSIASSFGWGLLQGAVTAGVVIGVGAGAVALGAPLGVVTFGLGALAVIGGVAAAIDLGIDIYNGDPEAVAEDLGALAGGAIVGGIAPKSPLVRANLNIGPWMPPLQEHATHRIRWGPRPFCDLYNANAQGPTWNATAGVGAATGGGGQVIEGTVNN